MRRIKQIVGTSCVLAAVWVANGAPFIHLF